MIKFMEKLAELKRAKLLALSLLLCAQNKIFKHIDSFLDKNNIHSRLNFIIARPLFSHTPQSHHA